MTRRQLLVALLVTIPLAACQRKRELSRPRSATAAILAPSAG